MKIEDLKNHFGAKQPTRKIREFSIGSYLVTTQLAVDYWAHYIGESEHAIAISVSKITNVNGIKMYQIILGKLMICFGSVNQQLTLP